MIDHLERVSGRPVSRETSDRLIRYVELLLDENERQNLIARSTAEQVWERHILDSAQLVRFAPRTSAAWVDVGSGAGLPGIVIAALTDGPMTLIEPRRLRAEFLSRAADLLGIGHRVTVTAARVEKVTGKFDVITARALAPLDKLLGLTLHLSHAGTLWALPKGRNANSELAEAQRNWHCAVRSEISCTDPAARILVLSKVGAKRKMSGRKA